MKNVGALDRIIRIVVGVILIVLTLNHTIGWWGWIGLAPLITGLIARCPAYTLLGTNTCSRKSHRDY